MNDTSIKENIIKTLLYYHIFNHPLTLDEIHCFCQRTNTSIKDIKRTLSAITTDKAGKVGESRGYYFIRPHIRHVDERLQKEAISQKRWKKAKQITIFLKLVPFVRGVFVTGTLSKNSSAENSDIDFMIICRENRIWVTRTLIQLFTKLFFLDNKCLCPNYFVSENNLVIDDRNIFTATELAHIKVMYNTDLLKRFIKNNSWIDEYFPNYLTIGDTYHFPNVQVSDKRSILQPFFEIFYPGKVGDAIDRFLEKITLCYHSRGNSVQHSIRISDRSMIYSRNTAKLHGHIRDHKYYILETYTKLLKQHNLFPHAGIRHHT